jgi:large subunit ribosomal protein L9
VKVVLTCDVKGAGKKGSVVEVAEGYARNYLIPRGFAREASAGVLKALEHEREAASTRVERLRDEAKRTAERVTQVIVRIPAKAGEGGRLFGSVTSQDIADALWKQHRIKIDKKRIGLEENIKTLGLHFVPCKLYEGVAAEVRVNVVEERTGESI